MDVDSPKNFLIGFDSWSIPIYNHISSYIYIILYLDTTNHIVVKQLSNHGTSRQEVTRRKAAAIKIQSSLERTIQQTPDTVVGCLIGAGGDTREFSVEV